MSNPVGAQRYGLGGGDAYYDAVKYGGYTGTREQFGRDQAEFAQNATAVAEAREEVERNTQTVVDTAQTFTEETVPAAIQSVEEKGDTEEDRLEARTTELVQAVEDKGEEVLNSIPADYTALSGEVDDLKNALSYIAEKTINETDYFVEIDNTNLSNIVVKTNNSGQTNLKLAITKGNILALPYFRASGYSQNGLTFTINDDYSITVNGTATADTYYNIAYYQNPLVATRLNSDNIREYGYYLSGCVDGSDSTYYLIERQTGKKCKTAPESIFGYSPSSIVNLCLFIKTGVTLTNKTFYPMLSAKADAEWTPPTTPYSATIESTETEYIWNGLQLFNGYNLLVINYPTTNRISFSATEYETFDDLQREIDTINETLIESGIVNQWKDKKWIAFGTSLTDNWSPNSYIEQGEHAGEHTGKYPPYLLSLSELSQSSFVNRGIAGGKINGHILYYIRYYTSDEANADLITIEGAVNDFAEHVPLGSVGDTVPYTNDFLPDSTAEGTFAGACYQAFTTAITNSPNAVVVLLTESTGKNHVGYADYRQTRKNDLGLTQWDYIDMTIKVAEFVGIPVITCGQDSMINNQNPDYIADHIHHTYLGGYQYAKAIWAKLKNIPLKATSLPE